MPLYTIAAWACRALEKHETPEDAQRRMRELSRLPQWRDAILLHLRQDGTVLGCCVPMRMVEGDVLGEVRRNNDARCDALRPD